VSIERKKNKLAKQRAKRTRMRLKALKRPRVSVFRSAKHIYAQVIDDNTSKTLASYSSLNAKDAAGDKKAVAHAVGVELAKSALDSGIEAVVFDRGPFIYHGRIQALAEGLREGGLKF